MTQELVFQLVDSWCFKDAKPMSAVGGTQNESVFPPPGETLAGAIKTWVAEQMGVDWALYEQHKQNNIETLIGFGETPGLLQFSEARLVINIKDQWQPLFPVPEVLRASADPEDKNLVSLLLNQQPVHCDIGKVRLASFPQSSEKLNPIHNAWLTQEGLQKCTEGTLPGKNDIITLEDIVTYETRVGIGRDNTTATVETGKLFQLQHLRFRQPLPCGITEVALSQKVAKLPDDLQATLNSPQLIRLGGEGRPATVQIHPLEDAAMSGKNLNNIFMLMLLNPVHFACPEKDSKAGAGWLPQSFIPKQQDYDFWQGEIGNITVKILSMVAQSPMRKGGWDLANRCPKAHKSYLRPGTCYFIECEQPDALSALAVKSQQQSIPNNPFGAFICLPCLF